MAKDDYHVIVYQILAYLYAQLKKGKPVEPEMLLNNGAIFEINHNYWVYIMRNMLEQGYISGIRITEGEGNKVLNLSSCQITPKGIEYICDDTMFDKVRDCLNGRKDVPEFI